MTDSQWESRVAEAWANIDAYEPDRFRALIDDLASELPDGSAVADFERGCAFDSTGHPAEAVGHYRAALATGLTGIRRRRAVIQLSSSLRNLGELDEPLALLRAERERDGDELDDAVICTLALVLTDLGRAQEAVSLTVEALAGHLPRYRRSMTNYARALTESTPSPHH